jgi:hypothetical protein
MSLSPRDLRALNRAVTKDRTSSLADVTDEMNEVRSTPVCSRTIRRAIHRIGKQSRIARAKPHLNERHRQRRLKFARDTRAWTHEQWSKVIWTDEASVEIGKQSRQVRVWRGVGEEYDADCIVPTFKSNRQSLMIWGCMAAGRLGPLIVIPSDRRTARDYVDLVLDGPLMAFYLELSQARGDVMIMEDGAPVHRSKLAQQHHVEHKIRTLDWPAQSPDMNPIEHVWKQLKLAINKRRERPKSLGDLETAIKEEWARLGSDLARSLVESMPKRVAALGQARGGHTKY